MRCRNVILLVVLLQKTVEIGLGPGGVAAHLEGLSMKDAELPVPRVAGSEQDMWGNAAIRGCRQKRFCGLTSRRPRCRRVPVSPFFSPSRRGILLPPPKRGEKGRTEGRSYTLWVDDTYFDVMLKWAYISIFQEEGERG
jgi:hypothetical protein